MLATPITDGQIAALRERLHDHRAKFDAAEVRALIQDHHDRCVMAAANVEQGFRAAGDAESAFAARVVIGRLERVAP